MAVSLRLDFLYVLRTVLLESLFLGVSLCGIDWVEVIDDYVRGDEGRFAVLQAEPVHRCLIVIFSLSRSPVKSTLKSSFFALWYNERLLRPLIVSQFHRLPASQTLSSQMSRILLLYITTSNVRILFRSKCKVSFPLGSSIKFLAKSMD